MKEIGCEMQEIGCMMQEIGCEMQEIGCEIKKIGLKKENNLLERLFFEYLTSNPQILRMSKRAMFFLDYYS